MVVLPAAELGFTDSRGLNRQVRQGAKLLEIESAPRTVGGALSHSLGGLACLAVRFLVQRAQHSQCELTLARLDARERPVRGFAHDFAVIVLCRVLQNRQVPALTAIA